MKHPFIRAALVVLIWLFGAISLAQAQVSTTTTISVSPNPAKLGTAFAVTVTVTSSTPQLPEGGIQLYRDGDYVAQGGIDANGQWAFSYEPTIFGNLPIGTYTWTAEFTGQSGFGSSSGTTTHTVNGIATTATLQVSPAGPVNEGTLVTLTANVTGTSGSPAGMVNFKDDNTTIGSSALVNGSATLSTSALTPGLRSLTVEFIGAGDFANSQSVAQYLQVNGSGGGGPGSTTTTVTTSPGTTNFGVPFTLVANVTSPGNAATGQVFFYFNELYVGSGTLSAGTASFAMGPWTATPADAPAPGQHIVRAEYSGDTTYTSSISPNHTHTVSAVPATITLTRSPNASTKVGQPLTLTATVSGAPTPTGTVDFKAGSTYISSTALINGVATITTTNLGVATHALTARYNGNAVHGAVTSSVLSHTVTNNKTTPTVTLSASPSVTSKSGELVELTARVSGNPSGTIVFRRGTVGIKTITLAGGVAKLRTILPIGTHSITAAYSGNSTTNAVTSAPLSHVVKVRTNISLASVAKLLKPGQSVTMTATVTRLASSSVPLAGQVAFMRGPTTIRVEPLVNGKATLTTTLPIGQHDIKAVYSGNATYASALSAEQFVEVGYARGTEFRVSVATHFDQKSPAVSALNDHAVAVWMGQTRAGGAYGLFARLFNEGGLPDGGEIEVTQPDYTIGAPAISQLTGRRYAVVWDAHGGGTNGQDIFVRLFEGRTALNTAKKVNTITANRQSNPGVFVAGSNLVIYWQSWNASNTRSDIYARVYNADGIPFGPAFRVHDQYVFDTAYSPAGAATFGTVLGLPGNTGFVIGWVRSLGTFRSGTVMAQRFQLNGTPKGSSVTIARGDDVQDLRLTTLLADVFVASWAEMQELTGAPRHYDVKTRLIDGNRLGTIMTVSGGSYSNDVSPKLGKLGAYIQDVYGRSLAFLSTPRGITKARVMVQAYGRFGALLGTPFILDSGQASNVSELAAADLGRGWYTLVLWNAFGQDGQQGGIFGRLVAAP